uniref:SMP-30/Gluconolactonase/LRE-like region domain-containing protein n=1 Tax=Amphimedon queenslandica TaxID=400682 RepID=A0A1X7TMT9_AMPQE
SANGQFQSPYDIAIDNQGLVYVADSDNHHIQKFSADGKFVGQFGTYGSGPGQLEKPNNIAIDTAANGLVYVSEWGNARISVFTSDGVFVSCFGMYLGHLLNLQYYTPDLFWKNLKQEGQPINILEHQQGLTTLQLSVLGSKSLTESSQEFVQEIVELVNRREFTMTGVVLGKEGWGEVKVAGFCGLKVAAKCLYEIVISPH